MARTDTLGHFLTDVATAIRNKKGTTDTIVASNFDTEIESIESGTDLSKYFKDTIAKGTSSSFPGWRDVLLSFPKIKNTGTSTDYMFYNLPCTNIDLSLFDTSKVTTMSNMFAYCNKLSSLDVSNFNTSNVTDMRGMFDECSVLTSLDLSNFNTSNVTDMSMMFQSCNSLRYLDIRNFDFTKVTSYSSMFDGVQANCEIIVKDDTAKQWVLAKRSDFTNVKTVAEKEAEQNPII